MTYRVAPAQTLTKRARQSGFTLLEILIAIALFALMFVAAQQMFSAALGNNERLAEEATRIENEQRLLTWMTTDLEQLAVRPVRDSLGSDVPALVGDDRNLAFTRAGWSNPLSLRQRSEMQRVEYFLTDGKLYRRYYPFLDVQPGTEPVDTVMLEDVDRFQVRYLEQGSNGQYQWLDSWPSSAAAASHVLMQPLPKSVEVTLTMINGRELHRFFRTVKNPW